MENVVGAQRWVGRAKWHFGSFYLWGDVPALMPLTLNAVKVPSFRFDGSGRSFQTASVRRTDPGKGARFTSRDCGVERGLKNPGIEFADIGFNVASAQKFGHMVEGVKMAAGSLRSTGNTPADHRVANDPNRYVSAFQFFSTQITDVPPRPSVQVPSKTWLQFPSLTGANSGPSGSPTFSPLLQLTASGVLICRLTDATYNSYYAGLPVQNRGFLGEPGFNVKRFSSDASWDGGNDYYLWHTGQSRGNQVVRGTCYTTGCGRVRSIDYLFGIEAPLPTGDNCAAITVNPDSDGTLVPNPVPSGNLGVMVRDANGVGDELLRPMTWTALPAAYPGKAIVYQSGVNTVATEMNIFPCSEGSIFVHPVGVKTVWQFRYDAGSNRLVLVRTIAIGDGGTSWNADTILSATLDYF